MAERCPYCGDSGRVIEPGRFSGDRSYSMTCDCVPRLPDQYQATLDAERAARDEADRLMRQPMDSDEPEAGIPVTASERLRSIARSIGKLKVALENTNA